MRLRQTWYLFLLGPTPVRYEQWPLLRLDRCMPVLVCVPENDPALYEDTNPESGKIERGHRQDAQARASLSRQSEECCV